MVWAGAGVDVRRGEGAGAGRRVNTDLCIPFIVRNFLAPRHSVRCARQAVLETDRIDDLSLMQACAGLAAEDVSHGGRVLERSLYLLLRHVERLDTLRPTNFLSR